MSASGTSFMASQGSAPSTGPRLVWTSRWSSGENLVVISDDEVAAAKVPARKLAGVREALENGQPLYDVLGPKGTYIQFHAMRSVSATLKRTELVVEYDKGGNKFASHKFPLPDTDSQVTALEEIQKRMGEEVQVVRTAANRLFYIMKPFNLMMVVLLIAGGFHQIATDSYGVGVDDTAAARRPMEPRIRPTRLLRGPAAKLGFVVVAAIAVTGFLLATLGYQLTLNILLGAAAAGLAWTLWRLTSPPVTYSLVSPRYAR